MDARAAAAVLEDAELVPVLQGPIRELKRLVDQLLSADVPVMLAAPEGCATGGCAPKAVLLARADDAPRVAEHLNRDWMSLLEAEGTVSGMTAVEVGEDEEPPCPACGTAAPLVEGACSDCGLHLG